MPNVCAYLVVIDEVDDRLLRLRHIEAVEVQLAPRLPPLRVQDGRGGLVIRHLHVVLVLLARLGEFLRLRPVVAVVRYFAIVETLCHQVAFL